MQIVRVVASDLPVELCFVTFLNRTVNVENRFVFPVDENGRIVSLNAVIHSTAVEFTRLFAVGVCRVKRNVTALSSCSYAESRSSTHQNAVLNRSNPFPRRDAREITRFKAVPPENIRPLIQKIKRFSMRIFEGNPQTMQRDDGIFGKAVISSGSKTSLRPSTAILVNVTTINPKRRLFNMDSQQSPVTSHCLVLTAKSDAA